jgi:periplasmic protein TonB
MSKLNINKSEWLELVFEGKNKAYGAYQLRQEDDSTIMKAFFISVLFLGSLVTVFMLSSFTEPKPLVNPILDDIIHITDVTLPTREVEPKQQQAVETQKQPPIKSKDLLNVTVVKEEDAPQIEITENDNLTSHPDTPNAGDGPVGPQTPNTGTSLIIPTEPVDMGNTILTPSAVDKNPMFPGGIEAFLRTVGSKFKTPEVEVEQTIRVIVLFVIEKDGTLSNITVPKNPGLGMGEEAIRVLKSIKTKWEPGMYKGKPVRTSFSLPIVVNIKTE